jgi:hypothetical protein
MNKVILLFLLWITLGSPVWAGAKKSDWQFWL